MKKIGLVPRLIIAITLGIVLGLVLPSPVIRIFVTFSSLFSKYLSFVIPFMIIGFVVTGISDLRQGAGKLLGITTLIAYLSTIIAGSLAYLMATNIFFSLSFLISTFIIYSPLFNCPCGLHLYGGDDKAIVVGVIEQVGVFPP